MNEAKEQIESLAALIGSTQAELAQLDEHIVGESTNLKRNQFDGKPLLMRQIQEVKDAAGVSSQPHQPSTPPPPSVVSQSESVPVVQPIPSAPAVPVQPAVAPVQSANYGSELTIILQKLVSIEEQIKGLNERIDSIEYFDKKVVDSLTRGLQNKVKQVTIKLDEVNRKQQK